MTGLSRACSSTLSRNLAATGLPSARRQALPTVVNRLVGRTSFPFLSIVSAKVEKRGFSSEMPKSIEFPCRDDLMKEQRKVFITKDPYLKHLNMVDEVVSKVGASCQGQKKTFEEISTEVDTALFVQSLQAAYTLKDSAERGALALRLTHLIVHCAKSANEHR